MYKGCDNLKIATSSYNNLADINTASNMYFGCNNIEILESIKVENFNKIYI